MLRRRQVPEHRLADGADHGHVWVLLDQTSVLEPAEPPEGRLDPSHRMGGLGYLAEQPSRSLRVPGGLGVIDRQIRLPVGLEPRGRSIVEAADESRLGASEFGGDDFAEQMMAAVPGPIAVQWYDQEIGVGQR